MLSALGAPSLNGPKNRNSLLSNGCISWPMELIVPDLPEVVLCLAIPQPVAGLKQCPCRNVILGYPGCFMAFQHHHTSCASTHVHTLMPHALKSLFPQCIWHRAMSPLLAVESHHILLLFTTCPCRAAARNLSEWNSSRWPSRPSNCALDNLDIQYLCSLHTFHVFVWCARL